MKRNLLLKTMLLLCALVVGTSSSWATDIATWGKVSFAANTAVKAGGGDTDNNNVATITSTKALTTSGTGNAYYGSSSGGATITIASLSLSNYTGISLSFYARASKGGKFTISTSVNGSTWSDLGEVSITSTEGKKSINNVPSSAHYIKLVHDQTSGSLYFGTVTISGTYVSKKNTSLSLLPNPLNLSYGGSTGSLTATVTPDGEAALASPIISWESSNDAVATVTDGVVTPHAEGSCTITATYAGDNNYYASSNTATVNVTDSRTATASAAASIWFQKTLYVGQSAAFTPNVTLDGGLTENDVTYSYVSADPSTIQINGDGTFTVLKTGTNIDITLTVTPVAAKEADYKPASFTFQHSVSYRYNKPLFTTSDNVESGNYNTSMTLTMANDGTPTGPIYYTTNSDEPATDKSNCTLYESAITLTATTTVKARVIDDNGLYSTVTSATYTRVPLQKDAISLGADESLSFTDFSGIGAYSDNVTSGVKTVYILSSDGEKYKWTGVDFGTYDSGNTVQLKSTTGTMTSVAVTAPYGFKMTFTKASASSTGVDVYVGSEKQTAVNGEYFFESGTAVTLKRSAGTPTVSNITFTALKQPVATNVAITDPGALTKGATGTFAYTKDSEAECTKAWTSSNASVINITDPATGAYTAAGRGTAKITLTLTPTDATNYKEATATLDVTVNEQVTITAEDINIHPTDEQAIGATTTEDYSGTLTYESDDNDVATVDASGNITAEGVGTATITITAPADATHYFTGNTKDITVTVSEGPKYIVTFDAGSGTCTTSSLTETDYKAGVTLPDVIPVDSWTFCGWAEDKDATSDFMDADDTYNPTADCTLYAIYSKGGFVSETTYTKTSSLATVKAGGKVVLLNNNKILKSTGTTISSANESNLTDITVTNDMIFTLSGDDTNGYTLTNADGYTLGAEVVATSGSGNNSKDVSMTSSNNKWIIDNHTTNNSADGSFVFKLNSNVALNNYNNAWKNYYNTSVTSHSNTKIYVFVPATETKYSNLPEVNMTDATDINDLIGSFVEEITYTRSMKQLSSIYLPYDSEVPAGMTAYEFVEQESATKLNFTEVTDSKLKAYTPYVLAQSETVARSLTGSNVTIVADTEGHTTAGNWTFKGTVVSMTNAEILEEAAAVSGTAYIINSGKWYPVPENDIVTIPAYRAYFICSSGGNAKVMDMSLNGETTGINGVEEIAPVTKTRKVVKNGRLVIETPNGEFTTDGAKIK